MIYFCFAGLIPHTHSGLTRLCPLFAVLQVIKLIDRKLKFSPHITSKAVALDIRGRLGFSIVTDLEKYLGGSNGGWVLGFSMKVGGSDIFQVEVRGIYEGLELAWSKGFSRIEVDYDNAILI
ncbi:hypothetical protein PVK06_034336 [Gossypium arboreum]|uniref:RNase H type-1 domain-containing protein n=1 Tax=Gossypium arboreum TaxID=29729 RepID=A0ABR0NDV2_GOSAR|nr:hypothetical protein PVK06_034336 [Gossypium arboreum]